MIDHGLDALDEAHRVRKAAVMIECRFVSPARVDIEQTRITNGPERANPQASRLLTGRGEHVDQRRRQGALVAGAA